jgi:hypothetical protein
MWKYALNSHRFRFPEYHLSANNTNLELDSIDGYLEACFTAKDGYENRINEIEEASKIKAAEAAMIALTREWITPVSRKVLWAWVRHYLPARYDADKQGWLNTLFLGGGNAIVEFQEEDLQMMEDIIVGECPAGTGVMKAVRERIEQIWTIWRAHHETFQIDLEDYAINQGLLVNGVQIAMPEPGQAPTLQDCGGNKTKHLIASAKWKIAKAAWDAQNARSDDPTINEQLGAL